MTKNTEINEQPVPNLPPVEGNVIAVAEKVISKKEIKSDNGSFDRYEFQVVLSSRIGSMRLAQDERRRRVSASGTNGKMIEDAVGKGPFIANIWRNDNGYFNIRHVADLKDLIEDAEELGAAIKG